jgi:hypothetical protein
MQKVVHRLRKLPGEGHAGIRIVQLSGRGRREPSLRVRGRLVLHLHPARVSCRHLLQVPGRNVKCPDAGLQIGDYIFAAFDSILAMQISGSSGRRESAYG